MSLFKSYKMFFSPVRYLKKSLCTFQKVRSISQTSNIIAVEKLTGNHEGIVTVGFNRPEAKNALSKNAVSTLTETFTQLKFDKNVRVIILHSLVKNVFCSGADLKERAAMPEAEVAPFVAKIRQSITDLQEIPVPTIAAIDGYALGGGLEIALGCDLRVSSSSAKMGLVETKLAIIPGGGGTQRLPRIVGPAIAKELIFTARIIDGKEAFRIGLVNHNVEQNEDGNSAFLRAISLGEEIAQQGPIALRLAKQAINRGMEVDINNGLAFEMAYYTQTVGTKDRVEGLMAFKEKRPPKFTAE
ncbi:methylglutaconyl-CoA hydratase, mitochondrial [Parasteatoda tepidariorum]|uniref:methylglutaconyl-CoA hydratase, mitochondrial n=1 Tax=Parasteatoda tepidariorum TaxID=114398 RepID=UPI00077FD2A9|nr:methylglutaconyl-CoA hydratase, mitochondrial [Parasteatoda tepidariorum]